jgi:DNA mismatch endonuclease (patch repair protein)
MDRISPEKRSLVMASIKAKDTFPEMIVRRAAHRLGYRFRLHRQDLPGKPDLVFPRLRKIIFVHGCFWHLHEGCKKSKLPVTNYEFWQGKLSRNRERDKENLQLLTDAGWTVLTLWECELANQEAFSARISSFLSATHV